ncbi:MAG: homogentisate 1,2-dioxygenase [Candidatus Marinimicrobia bacterium]|nr:homogentisate 1,2-dioxygenase [Candidatus Neomarinimicrobiota bacterium]|tara:strand:+ start:49 stop:1194 length:1146 start_codon:yes stop_codon:yes gene_type:complete
MPFYQKRGEIPEKKHTQFKDANENLFWEELISRQGFSHMYSNVYHINPPTAIKKIGAQIKNEIKLNTKINKHRHLKTAKVKSQGDAISARVPLFLNQDIMVSKGHIDISMKDLFKNAYSDEILFIQSGEGILKTNFGYLNLSMGDYIVIPRGVIWKIEIAKPMKILVIESHEPVETPERYRNKFGQLLEHSPFSERDIITPTIEKPIKNKSVTINVKYHNTIQSYKYDHHPFDIIGWDGYYYPWKFNIKDFMPITGKIHQPPPVHQTFQSKDFVICSFVPRLFDYHEKAIPAPYAHSNLDSEELIFYVEGDFMSRKGIEPESITYHPMGLTHGPQPGKIEESIGAKETSEFAVMIDTFKPLHMTIAAEKIEDKNYIFSWNN